MSLIEYVHGGYVHRRRVRVLSEHLAELMPPDARILDVGCGDGLLAFLIGQKRLDVELQGIDVLIREQTYIPVERFDGQIIPYTNSSFDVVMFVDVLHHTKDPMVLLREARRVARRAIVIKDHCRNGLLAEPTLHFMDRVGNARQGVVLTYNYWPRQRWFSRTLKVRGGIMSQANRYLGSLCSSQRIFPPQIIQVLLFEACKTLGLQIEAWITDLGLYPWPVHWIFERSLHFVARLSLTSAEENGS